MHKIIHSYKEMTPRELSESKKISKAFNKQYWKKLKQSTISPLIRKEDYVEIFNTACEILSRIRCTLQLNFTMTGNATNYLLQLVDIEPANENFMRTIVHEALKDSKGYINKLDKINVDRFIDDHLSYIKNRNEKKMTERRERVNKVKDTWQDTIKNMQMILEKTNNMQESYNELFIEDNKTHEPFILEIAERLENLNDSLAKFTSFQEKRKQKMEKKLNREINNHHISPNETENEKKTKEENPKEDKSTNENISQENQLQEEIPNQNEIDEKVMISVQKVGESIENIQEKVHSLQKNTDLHHLEEISELPFEQKKEKVKYLRKNTIALAEKLSEHLFNLDQLVGSSEKVRPYKKKQVNEIQSILGQVDNISENLKKLESDLKHQEEQLKEKEEKEREKKETKERERKEREEREMMENLEQNEREQFQKDFEERIQREREERENYLHNKYHNQKNFQKNQNEGRATPKKESFNIDKLGDFPLPTKDQWRKVQYEAEFEVKKSSDKYNLQSYIPNLDTQELQILEKDNVLTISGVRYPTEQEEKALIQKLLNYLKYYSSNIDDWENSDFVRAILKVGSGSFGSFKISYSLPDDYDNKSEISASYLRGVLEINVPIFHHKKRFIHPFFSDSLGYDNFWSK